MSLYQYLPLVPIHLSKSHKSEQAFLYSAYSDILFSLNHYTPINPCIPNDSMFITQLHHIIPLKSQYENFHNSPITYQFFTSSLSELSLYKTGLVQTTFFAHSLLARNATIIFKNKSMIANSKQQTSLERKSSSKAHIMIPKQIPKTKLYFMVPLVQAIRNYCGVHYSTTAS